MRVVAFIVACCVAVLAPTRAYALDQSVTVTRPEGQLVISLHDNDVEVVDTRADDPGWIVAGVAEVVAATSAQRVTLANGVATAPAHHGLGIAHLTLQRNGDVVTLTVI